MSKQANLFFQVFSNFLLIMSASSIKVLGVNFSLDQDHPGKPTKLNEGRTPFSNPPSGFNGNHPSYCSTSKPIHCEREN